MKIQSIAQIILQTSFLKKVNVLYIFGACVHGVVLDTMTGRRNGKAFKRYKILVNTFGRFKKAEL